ncbi:MAG: hypothetical protein K2X55_02400 [Burkholderiaceae bacterium]|nr:hypothetical protein [Burkholderiaceae bacterium]
MAKIEIVNEPTYTFGSADNTRRYDIELDLSGKYRHSSVHGVIIDDIPTVIVGASGGVTGIHARSMLEVEDRAYLAVGPYVVCFSPSPFQYHWVLEVDPATCFGVYFHARTGALLSHGELEIARFTSSGEIIWSESGVDIFSEEFALHDDFVEATDFNGDVYRFSYVDGHQFAQQSIPVDTLRRG